MRNKDLQLARLGPFADIWDEGPAHLKLLGLRDPDAGAVVEKIAAILMDSDCSPYICALFLDPNWRPHLVGAIACLIEPKPDLLKALWDAVDRGSWVTPQLAVVAYFADPDFPAQARARIEARCPVSSPQELSPAERHSATGPEDGDMRAAKMLASLLTLCERVPVLAASAHDLRAEQDIRDMLKIDESWNRSARITADWLKRATRLFAERGTPLTLKFAAPQQGE